jgi:hypothetical protein
MLEEIQYFYFNKHKNYIICNLGFLLPVGFEISALFWCSPISKELILFFKL